MELDIVTPLYQGRWITRAVIEGIIHHYDPRRVHIVTVAEQVGKVREQLFTWNTRMTEVVVHDEDVFFPGLPKHDLLKVFSAGENLYQPGWYYQQLLKLGAREGIEGLSDPYLVWDSDLLPIETWPVWQDSRPTFALLQHVDGGNPGIVSKWRRWTEDILQVPWLTDAVGTFVPHHMWFASGPVSDFQRRVRAAFPGSNSWQGAMLESVATYDTFSEYGSYASLAAHCAPDSFNFHPYETYGATSERFFDDGTCPFGQALSKHLERSITSPQATPSYAEVETFVRQTYYPDVLPSSIAFEANPRHLEKAEENLHVEERRSRWNARDLRSTGVCRNE